MRQQGVNVEVGRRLRVRRLALGLTQVQVAEKAGIDRSFLCDVERARKGISIFFLQVLAQTYDTTLSVLLEGL